MRRNDKARACCRCRRALDRCFSPLPLHPCANVCLTTTTAPPWHPRSTFSTLITISLALASHRLNSVYNYHQHAAHGPCSALTRLPPLRTRSRSLGSHLQGAHFRCHWILFYNKMRETQPLELVRPRLNVAA